jgi:2-polyprenyl-3-methyl-5-hydroxy-6-metoxy-1,4-benzoquinol methylase
MDITTLRCPICSGNKLHEFLNRNSVPVHQNLVLASRKEALSVKSGNLALTVCHDCGFIFNHLFNEKKLSYGEAYDNSQSYSQVFKKYLDDLADHLISEKGVHDSHIIEIGCGKGEFLRLLITNPSYGNTGTGFDPSYVGPASALNKRATFKRCFYGEDCANIPADVVVCRHVIEHVPDPLKLLNTIRYTIRNSPLASLYFETPCVEWILNNLVIWDFFYEHCSLFSASSLRNVFELSGFKVRNIQHTYGDQYLWLEAALTDEPFKTSLNAGNTPLLAQKYGRDEKLLRKQWHSKLCSLKQKGKVAIWGAGAKGTTLAHLIDPDCILIDCLIDLNPNKQGKYIPGTGHPIIGMHELPGRDIKTAIIMNPNYLNEIEKMVKASGINIQLIV